MENRRAEDFLGCMDFTAALPELQNYLRPETGEDPLTLQTSVKTNSLQT